VLLDGTADCLSAKNKAVVGTCNGGGCEFFVRVLEVMIEAVSVMIRIASMMMCH
jgi:hypothetical protein